GMVFQDPMTSLTPHLTVGGQIAEVIRRHRGVGRAAAHAAALTLLERVQVSDPERRMQQYPHELSGGLRQRVMIAIALSSEPQLLIADEPTTSLDVTVQAQILALLAELKRERAMGMVLITHDLGAVAGVADRVGWMGEALADLPKGVLRALRRDLQIIFQDPLGSLDPRMTVGEIVGEPLRVHAPHLDRAARAAQLAAVLRRVGLTAELASRYPHELSGGQCQRVGIARATILKPRLLICDEPVSALDVPTQQQIVTLL